MEQKENNKEEESQLKNKKIPDKNEKNSETSQKNRKKEEDQLQKELKRKEIKNTEEFLENNLSDQASKFNKEEEKKSNISIPLQSIEESVKINNDKKGEESYEIEIPNEIESKQKKSMKSINSKQIKQKEEIVFIKQIIPINCIYKIRQKNIKINSLIPKKKRLFVTKIINPKKIEKNEEDKISIIPISSICYTTKSPLIQSKIKFITSIINEYCFYTKIHLNKENNAKNKKIKTVNKFPCKIYRKAIVKTGKIKFGIIKKNKYEGLNNNIISNNINDNNLSKRVKKTEKISLVSKNKLDSNSSQGEENRLILRNDNNLKNNNEFSSKDGEANTIDITIHFSNNPINLKYNIKEKEHNNNINTNKRKLNFKKGKNRFEFNLANKKNKLNICKNISNSLYKDLREINNKLDSRNDYIKKHYHLDYPKHIGDQKNCPICIEDLKKGREMEKEKGLFKAFSFGKYKIINRNTLNKLKPPQMKKNPNNQKLDSSSDDERKKNNMGIWNSLNQQNPGICKKYIKFNNINRSQRFKRYERVENYKNYHYSKNDNNQLINDGRSFGKSWDIFNGSEYPLLKNYFHNNDYKANNYFN